MAASLYVRRRRWGFLRTTRRWLPGQWSRVFISEESGALILERSDGLTGYAAGHWVAYWTREEGQ